MGNLRYFDRTKDSVNYRTFVEGFPVFSNDLKGQVDIRITNNDGAAPSVTINTSVNTIRADSFRRRSDAGKHGKID